MVTIQSETIKFLKEGHVTSPKGFLAGGLHCGIRKKRRDFGWLHSVTPAVAAGVYTMNAFQAAPLKVTKRAINTNNHLQAVIVNSGIANACTGHQGEMDAEEMQQVAAEKLNIPKNYVGVASTGLIGSPLPMGKIKKAISEISVNKENAPHHFEDAILTTDTVTKHVGVQLEIDGKTITIGGAAKGSGMIHPNMATMLGFITTDAAVEAESLQLALRQTTDQTFNMITVDGDCSTNDMVLVMANGQQENSPLNVSHPQWSLFVDALKMVSEELAKMIARDGEGATKLIEVKVTGAPSQEVASQIAKSVISSNLVKTAIYGADPNWGRIICAVGYSEQPINPDKICIHIGEIPVVKDGVPLSFNEQDGKHYLQQENITLHVNLQDGLFNSTGWGCDLTYDYVKINASYRT
ncbi:bifunctional glutamate N-acetyltransferase/amino-acid acetyltransferase ArgJ [Oceanobacillus manasiensis]|uniref:bifunctional glutamate N-acetyltransferase/amino-acid acetyltransferase ArgJ n=1 Tax=Oceanobacillus manasiensis TaxID=586413 RepID=UPI0005A8CDB1|nr:bifunctional glutamate N-acetyltransferase/amino-acid acetyltransferase ArgJ [Oceanobacillus manasiensis]